MEKVKIKIVDPKQLSHTKSTTEISAMTVWRFRKSRLRLTCGNTASGLPYRDRNTRKETQYHVSRFVPVLLYGRLVWFSVMELGQSMTSIREKYLPCSITSCQTCHATR